FAHHLHSSVFYSFHPLVLPLFAVASFRHFRSSPRAVLCAATRPLQVHLHGRRTSFHISRLGPGTRTVEPDDKTQKLRPPCSKTPGKSAENQMPRNPSMTASLHPQRPSG